MKIGITFSTFDLLHAGHIAMLREAREQCDYLIAGLQVDPTIDRPEKNKPIQTIVERYTKVKGVRYVNEIIPYVKETDIDDILLLRNGINIRILGVEYEGKDFSGKATGEELKNIWSGLMNTILAKNDEVKTSNTEVDESAKAGTEGVIETKSRLGIVTGQLAKIEANSYATSLSGLRSTISGYLAQAVAKALNFEAAKGLAGLITGSIVAIGMTKLFDTFIPKFAMGGEMMVDKPQLFLAGEAGRERVTVEREDGRGFQSGKGVQVNISAPLVDETVRDSILPAIQKAIRNELA